MTIWSYHLTKDNEQRTVGAIETSTTAMTQKTTPAPTLRIQTFFTPKGDAQAGAVTKEELSDWCHNVFIDNYIEDVDFDSNFAQYFDQIKGNDGLFYFEHSVLEKKLSKYSNDKTGLVYSDYTHFLAFLTDGVPTATQKTEVCNLF